MKIKQTKGNILITDNNDSIKHILPSESVFFHKHPTSENALLATTNTDMYAERKGITIPISELKEVDYKVLDGYLSAMLSPMFKVFDKESTVVTGIEPYYPLLMEIKDLTEYEQTLSWYKKNSNLEPLSLPGNNVMYRLEFSSEMASITTALSVRTVYRDDKPNLIKYQHITSSSIVNGTFPFDLTPNLDTSKNVKVFLYSFSGVPMGHKYQSLADIQKEEAGNDADY